MIIIIIIIMIHSTLAPALSRKENLEIEKYTTNLSRIQTQN